MLITNLTNIVVFITLVGSLTPAAIGLGLLYPFAPKLTYKLSDYVVKVLAPRLFIILGTYKGFRLKFSRENKEKLPEQFLMISNHQSLLDIPLYMTFLPEYSIRFVAKDALGKNIPLVSPMLKSHGHCFIPRKGGMTKAMQTMDVFGKHCVEKKFCPVIFPEGTRSKDGSIGKFFTAGFRRLSDATKLPVVVACVDDGYKVNDMVNVMENLNSVNYRAKILAVYPSPATKEDQVKLLDEAKVLMEEQLRKWRSGEED